jgi:hypothetical protein
MGPLLLKPAPLPLLVLPELGAEGPEGEMTPLGLVSMATRSAGEEGTPEMDARRRSKT